VTGKELQRILLNKWGKSYDIRLRKIGGRLFLQIMWKYLEQGSFPFSEREYIEHLDDISLHLNAWGGKSQIEAYLKETKHSPRMGKVVNVPIDLGGRAAEWILT